MAKGCQPISSSILLGETGHQPARPTGGGIEIHVRYITRAQDRQATRANLYQAIVELLHGKEAQPAATGAAG